MKLYICEFFRFIHNVKHQYEIVFEILPLENDQNLDKNQHPIRVHIINGERIINGDAVAVVAKWDYIGFTLFNILWKGVNYVTGYDAQYWFPSYPQDLADGSLRVHLANYSDSRSRVRDVENSKGSDVVFLTPLDALSLDALSLNALPFMDASGTFVYQYTMVSKIVTIPRNDGSYKDDIVFPELNTPVTLYQTDNKFEVMVDNSTRKAHPIADFITFYEMPVYSELL